MGIGINEVGKHTFDSRYSMLVRTPGNLLNTCLYKVKSF